MLPIFLNATPGRTSGETRLMTDLPCESIELLEIGARLGQTFHILIDDDVAFLRSLRYHVAHGGELGSGYPP